MRLSDPAVFRRVVGTSASFKPASAARTTISLANFHSRRVQLQTQIASREARAPRSGNPSIDVEKQLADELSTGLPR